MRSVMMYKPRDFVAKMCRSPNAANEVLVRWPCACLRLGHPAHAHQGSHRMPSSAHEFSGHIVQLGEGSRASARASWCRCRR